MDKESGDLGMTSWIDLRVSLLKSSARDRSVRSGGRTELRGETEDKRGAVDDSSGCKFRLVRVYKLERIRCRVGVTRRYVIDVAV